MKIQLKQPILLTPEATPITELTLREKISAGDVRGLKISALQDPSIDDVLTIAGRLAGQPAAVLNNLAIEDLGPVMEAVYSFLWTGRSTGKTQ